MFCGKYSIEFCWITVWFRDECVPLWLFPESGWASGAEQKQASPLITMFEAEGTDNNLLNSSTVNISSFNTLLSCNMHATVLRLYKVTHYEAQNCQVKLFFYLIMSWTHFSSSLYQCLLPSSLLYLLLLTPPPDLCCSRKNDITPSPVDCSVWKLDVYVCVCMHKQACLKSTPWSWQASAMDSWTWRNIIFTKNRSCVWSNCKDQDLRTQWCFHSVLEMGVLAPE